MHKAQQILERILQILESISPAIVQEVKLNRLRDTGLLPSIAISMGDDTPNEQSNTSFLRSHLTINTNILVSAVRDIDKTALKIRTEIHKLLLADTTLGLSGVIQIQFSGQGEPEISHEANNQTAIYPLTWLVEYQTSYSNPEV